MTWDGKKERVDSSTKNQGLKFKKEFKNRGQAT